MSFDVAIESLNCLSKYITIYYDKKPIILLDEYDTPMQEAWINGYFDDISNFLRGLFNLTFKTNKLVERGLLTGITCVSKESMFSDVNNLQVVTVTTPLYTDYFGFTEEEVFSSMDEYNLSNKDKVKAWYDGFIFGGRKNIYDPWSILKYLSLAELDTYWADTSSNSFASDLIRQSNSELKIQLETLLQKKSIVEKIDEQIVFNRLYQIPNEILSLFIASGYFKVLSYDKSKKQYIISLTNYEVQTMRESLISEWFHSPTLVSISREFISALFECRTARMNAILNKISLEIFIFLI